MWFDYDYIKIYIINVEKCYFRNLYFYFYLQSAEIDIKFIQQSLKGDVI